MRRSLLLLVALSLTCTSIAGAAERRLGIISGFNIAKLDIEGRGGDTRTSFAAGVVADLPFNDALGLRIEPMFTSKGGKGTTSNIYWGTVDRAEFQLDCIDIPVLLRYNLASQEAAHAYLLGGFGLSLFTEQKADIEIGPDKETVGLSDILQPWDLSLNMGVGLEFPAGANRFTVDARFGMGLFDINGGGNVMIADQPVAVPSTTTHNVEFRILGSLLFPWPGN
jgi:opacity protein-like surface antigen